MKSQRQRYYETSLSYITRQERDAEIAANRASRRHHPYGGGRQQQQQMHMQQHQDSFPLQEMQMRQQLIDQQIHIEQMQQMRMGQQQLQLLQRQQNYNEDFSQDVYAQNLMAGGARQTVTGNVAQVAFQATAALLSLNSGIERGGGGGMHGMHPNNGMGPPLVNPSLSFLDDTFAQAFIPQQQHQGYAANNARSYNQYNSYQPAPGPIEPWVIDGTWFNDTAFGGGGFADQAAAGGAAYRQHFPSQEDQRYQQLSHDNRQFVRGGGRHGGGGGRKRR
jgi:hypothetical protein